MKRYFDIKKDRLTLEIGVNSESESYTVREIEEVLGFSGLREVDKQEFDKLTRLYKGNLEYNDEPLEIHKSDNDELNF